MTHETVRPSACLDPETLGTLAEGRLTGTERAAAVRHLATCRRCHEIFASSVQILEGEGVLPAARDASAAPAPRRPLMVWLSAAAASLVAVVLFVQRAPLAVPRIADASPTPVPTASVATVTPSPSAVQTADLPPEAVEALRTLGGFELPYAVPPAVGFAPDPHKLAARRGIEDVDAVARALASRAAASPPALSGSVDGWRRIGRILEASRLALAAPAGTPDAFFASPWAAAELAHAGRVLRAAGVADAQWTADVRRGPIDAEAAEKLLGRLEALLAELG